MLVFPLPEFASLKSILLPFLSVHFLSCYHLPSLRFLLLSKITHLWTKVQEDVHLAAQLLASFYRLQQPTIVCFFPRVCGTFVFLTPRPLPPARPHALQTGSRPSSHAPRPSSPAPHPSTALWARTTHRPLATPHGLQPRPCAL